MLSSCDEERAMTSEPLSRAADCRSATEVWYVDLAAAAAALHALEAELPRLSEDEHARARRLTQPDTAAAWLAAHVALRLVLERCCGRDVRRLAFAVREGGKPVLSPGAGPAFSLSHTAGHALIAIAASEPLGVDIETPRKVAMEASRRASIEAAGAVLSRQPLPEDADARFLQAWVRIEALAKSEGVGLSRVLSRAGAFGRGRGRGVAPDLLGDDTTVADLALGAGLFGAVATASGGSGVQLGRLPVDVHGLRAFALGLPAGS
jgi:4'-phosphopantetheinyl transferase